MSKYLLIMRGTDESNAAMMASLDELMVATRRFIEDLVKSGVYVAAEGLDDPGEGVVVHFVDVASEQEAVEWAKRVPAAPGAKIEVRRVPGSDEAPQVNG